jgi:hypothetical protein
MIYIDYFKKNGWHLEEWRRKGRTVAGRSVDAVVHPWEWARGCSPQIYHKKKRIHQSNPRARGGKGGGGRLVGEASSPPFIVRSTSSPRGESESNSVSQRPMELRDFHADRRGLGVGRPDTRTCQIHIFWMVFQPTHVCRSICGMDWTENLVDTCLSKWGLIEFLSSSQKSQRLPAMSKRPLVNRLSVSSHFSACANEKKDSLCFLYPPYLRKKCLR